MQLKAKMVLLVFLFASILSLVPNQLNYSRAQVVSTITSQGATITMIGPTAPYTGNGPGIPSNATTSYPPTQQNQPPAWSSLAEVFVAVFVIALVVVIAIAIFVRKKDAASRGSQIARETPTHGGPGTMFCRHCGARVPRDSIYCRECGKQP